MSYFPRTYFATTYWALGYFSSSAAGTVPVPPIPPPQPVGQPERVIAVSLRAILTPIARHLLEPDISFSSGPWTRDEIVGYVNNAQNEFVIMTGLLKAFGAIVGQASTGEYADPPYALGVERISYNGKKLYPQTQQALNLQKSTWRTDVARNPRRFHRDGLAPHTFRVWPIPSTEVEGYTVAASPFGLIRSISGGSVTYTTGLSPLGTIRSITGTRNYFSGAVQNVPRGATGIPRTLVNTRTNFFTTHDVLPPTLITDDDVVAVPAAFIQYVMWGALSRIWAVEGEGQDLKRSRYCHLRFKRGVELAQRIVFGTRRK